MALRRASISRLVASKAARLAGVEGPQVRRIDDRSAVTREPVGERSRHGLPERTLVIQDKGLPLAKGAEGEVRRRGAFLQLGRDHPKEGVAAAAGSQPCFQP